LPPAQRADYTIEHASKELWPRRLEGTLEPIRGFPVLIADELKGKSDCPINKSRTVVKGRSMTSCGSTSIRMTRIAVVFADPAGPQ
jgi:hypothetical protein